MHELPLPDECLTELKKGSMGSTHGMLTVVGATGLSQVIDVMKYNKLYHLLRVTTYVFRFIKILTRSVRESIVQELIKSEIEWVKEAQIVLVLNEKFQMWKGQFRLFLDSDGVWRCGGRLANANAPYSTRFPILLLKTHNMYNC